MSSVEQELWNIFTFYTLHGNPLDPEHMRVRTLDASCSVVHSGRRAPSQGQAPCVYYRDAMTSVVSGNRIPDLVVDCAVSSPAGPRRTRFGFARGSPFRSASNVLRSGVVDAACNHDEQLCVLLKFRLLEHVLHVCLLCWDAGATICEVRP